MQLYIDSLYNSCHSESFNFLLPGPAHFHEINHNLGEEVQFATVQVRLGSSSYLTAGLGKIVLATVLNTGTSLI